MALVLAVDPDHAHSRTLARLTRELAGHEIVVTASCDEALAAIDQRVPDLVLLPLFLSPADEAGLSNRLRGFSGNDQPQTLAVPLMACEGSEEFAGTEKTETKARWFYWFKPRAPHGTPGLDARSFAAEIRVYLERARSSRAAAQAEPQFAQPPPVEAPAFAPTSWSRDGESHLPERDASSMPDPITFLDRPPAWRTALEKAKVGFALASNAAARIRPWFKEHPEWLQISTYPRWLLYGTPSLVLVAGVTLTVGLPSRMPSWASTKSSNGVARLQSVPDGSEVVVDGKKLGVTPFDATLPAGAHLVEFRFHGVSRTVSLDVTAGQSTELKVDWKKQPTARLLVTSEPNGANISIDGKPRGVAPLTIDDLSIGQHVVVFEHSGGSVSKTVKLKPNEATTLMGSIYSGWLTLFSPVELQITEGGQRVTLDEHSRAMLSAGHHELQLSNKALGYRGTQNVEIQPGEFTTVSVVLPKTTVSITATPNAEVWIDGVRAGETPLMNVPVELGTREFVLKNPTLGERRVAATATTKPLRIDVDFTKPEA